MILTMAMAIGIPTIMTMAITAGNALIILRRPRSITPARHVICRHRLTLSTMLRRFGVNPRRHSTEVGVSKQVGPHADNEFVLDSAAKGCHPIDSFG
jgi:hypothetical protein